MALVGRGVEMNRIMSILEGG
jgi:hypothetical protein